MKSQKTKKHDVDVFDVYDVIDETGTVLDRSLTDYEAEAYCETHNEFLSHDEFRADVIRRSACVIAGKK